jgi:hypothetical protein
MKVVADCLQYLTDRVYGRPQQTVSSNQAVKIELQWSGSPEWLQRPNVQVNTIASEDTIKRLVESSSSPHNSSSRED